MSETVSLKEAQKEIQNKMDQLKNELKVVGEKLFREGAQDIFDKYPNVGSFSWSQYTPYFNDGDECVFRVNDYFEVNDTNDELLYEDVWGSPYVVDKKRERGEAVTEEDELGIDLSGLVGSVDEDTLKALFGDHVQVTVSREGITVEEYEHE